MRRGSKPDRRRRTGASYVTRPDSDPAWRLAFDTMQGRSAETGDGQARKLGTEFGNLPQGAPESIDTPSVSCT